MNNDPIQSITNQLNEAANRLATMMMVGFMGMVGLLALWIAFRVWFRRHEARKLEQQLEDHKKVLHAIHTAQVQQQAATTWYSEEPEAGPVETAISLAINTAFDSPLDGLEDGEFEAGDEAVMEVVLVEDHEWCEECFEDTGVTVHLVLFSQDGTPKSFVQSTACSTCHKVIAT